MSSTDITNTKMTKHFLTTIFVCLVSAHIEANCTKFIYLFDSICLILTSFFDWLPHKLCIFSIRPFTTAAYWQVRSWTMEPFVAEALCVIKWAKHLLKIHYQSVTTTSLQFRRAHQIFPFLSLKIAKTIWVCEDTERIFCVCLRSVYTLCLSIFKTTLKRERAF